LVKKEQTVRKVEGPAEAAQTLTAFAGESGSWKRLAHTVELRGAKDDRRLLLKLKSNLGTDGPVTCVNVATAEAELRNLNAQLDEKNNLAAGQYSTIVAIQSEQDTLTALIPVAEESIAATDEQFGALEDATASATSTREEDRTKIVEAGMAAEAYYSVTNDPSAGAVRAAVEGVLAAMDDLNNDPRIVSSKGFLTDLSDAMRATSTGRNTKLTDLGTEHAEATSAHDATAEEATGLEGAILAQEKMVAMERAQCQSETVLWAKTTVRRTVERAVIDAAMKELTPAVPKKK